MKRACKECEFYADEQNNQFKDGECRRHAPTWQWQAEKYEDISGWPGVRTSDWCGEFQPREVEKLSKPGRPAPVPCVDMGGRPQDHTSCMDFEPYGDSGLCTRSGWCAMRRRPADEKKEQER